MGSVSLPIDALLPEVLAALRQNAALVLEAPPGAGKTTRVPAALLEAGLAGEREIVVLQPRRLATRLAAARVAEEANEPLGQRIGYQIRFEDISGPRTRLRFVTEGVLTRRLMSDAALKNVGVVVLDEFHERHLATDISLALLKRLQATARPDLKLVVMSATLDAAPVAAYLQDAPRLRSEGRTYEVTVEHLPQADDRPLEQQVLAALKRLVADGLDGHVLTFLPGAAEIRRAQEACAEFAERHALDVFALHGDLPAQEQDRVLRPSARRKVILSTNVAETSVTFDGVAAVVDSGLARVATHSPWSGLPALKVTKVSKAAATQRAGRAGRTRAGRCLRLFTRADYEGRLDFEVPEIRRLDLAETVLALRASGVESLSAFDFFEAPAAAAMEAAELLLVRLGAVDGQGRITPEGRRMVQLPTHPRLAKLVLEAERRGAAEDGATLAALLSERDVRLEARATFDSSRTKRAASGTSDLLDQLDRFEAARAARFSPDRLRALHLDVGATKAADRVRQALRRQVRSGATSPTDSHAREEALLKSVLAAYPDRVARRRKEHAPDVLLFEGGSAALADTSVVREAQWLVAVDAEERGRGVIRVRTASGIEPEWLLECRAEDLTEEDSLHWNSAVGRVDRVTRMTYGKLVLEEDRRPAPPSPEAARLLARALLDRGGLDEEVLGRWKARLATLAAAYPEAGVPAPDAGWLERALEQLCADRTRLDEVELSALNELLGTTLPGEVSRLLASQLPDRLTLPGGRQLKVHYEAGKPPWVESRLQDFFGMAQTPRVCGGRVSLVVHLLAPNQRAVQVTTDLAGFWERHYPALRKELGRRYPRHAWPEDPAHAQPPPPRKPC